MTRAWLIARKDMKEAFGRRALLLRFGIGAFLLPIFYGVMTGQEIRSSLHHPQGAAAALGGSIPLFAAIVAVMGSLLAIMITADAIAGEKERRTIETLLATPTSDVEIFVGKVLAAFVPAIITGYGGGVLFFVSAKVAAGPAAAATPVPLMLSAAGIIAIGVPICTIVMAAAGVMISARCGTATSAQQITSLTVFPLLGLIIYVAIRAAQWSTAELLSLLVGMLALCVVLLLLGARSLGREELVARLD